MDKASNGLNAAAAYDLACRYNNLFQYNPAAVAACAAAYGNIFNGNGSGKIPASASAVTQGVPNGAFNISTNTNSVSSPTNSSVSSSSSNLNGNNSNSSTSSINGSTAVIPNPCSPKNETAHKADKINEEEKGKELGKEREIKGENSFESVSDEINDSIQSEDEIEENSLASHLKELNDKSGNENEKKVSHSRSSSISSLNSAASSISNTSFKENAKAFESEMDDENADEFERVNNENNEGEVEIEEEALSKSNVVQEEFISNTKKAIEDCFNEIDEDDTPQQEKFESNEEYEDDIEKCPAKKLCTSDRNQLTGDGNQNQASLGSILDSLTAQCSPSPSQSSPKSVQAAKLIKKVDDLKSKLSLNELNSFKSELITSVNRAIQDTFKKFFDIEKESVKLDTDENSKPKQNMLKKVLPPPPPSHNFNMSNLLESSNHNIKRSGVRVGDLNKRKLSTGSHQKSFNQQLDKQAKYSAQSLINMPDGKSIANRNSLMLNTHNTGSTPSLSSSSSTSSSSNKQSVVNQFYSAALSHLHNPSHHQQPHHKSSNGSNFSMNSLVNNNPGNVFPPTPSQYNNSLLTSSNQQTPSMSSIFGHNPQQHQFLLSAAAAAAAVGQNSTAGSAHAQNSNYFNMAAAANRLFTPYLLDHHHHQQHSNQPLISTPNAPNKNMNRSSNFNQINQGPNLFHAPGKRRRTKVTDTRLSPRNSNNPNSIRSNSLLQMGSGMHGKHMEDYNKLKMNGSQSPSHSINDNDDQENYNQDYDENHKYIESQEESGVGNMQMNEDDSMSSCNENGGQLATMPNGCFSSSLFLGQSQNESQMNQTSDTNGIDVAMSTSSEYTGYQTSTLSSLHLRKAKLMFFFTRYPSSTILRNYFPDVKFNKANTAQLVKWFSNFREFFYIQMEKYARQHLAEGVQHADELHVDIDSEIFRALNSHYNRNNQLDIPASFCYVIEATLKEFFKSIQEGKDLDPSWKKAIYKVIARMDDTIPEFFKSIKWMETLESSI